MGVFENDCRFNRKNYFELFSASLGAVAARQAKYVGNISKGRDFDVNLEDGIISFNEREVYDIQIIGKENIDRKIWQWGFEKFDKFDSSYLELAKSVQGYGKKYGNEALREPCFNIDQMYNGHNLATIAVGVQKDNYCYQACPHPTGSLFVAVCGLPDYIFAKVSLEKFMNYTLDCINVVAVNQKVFVEHFLFENGTPFRWLTKAKLVADFGEQHLMIDFKPGDGFLNIVQMHAYDPVEFFKNHPEYQEKEEDK